VIRDEVGVVGSVLSDQGSGVERVGAADVRGGRLVAVGDDRDTGSAVPSDALPEGESPLARVLRRALPEDTEVLVQASRVHSFARLAPSDGSHVCLKLVDASDGAVAVRVYAPLDRPTGVLAQKLLPWGREHRVRVRLQWREGGGASALSGHWVVESLEDAGAVLSLVP
jgi:hypothetical protein